MNNDIYFFHWCKGSDYFSNYQIKSRFISNKMHFYCFLPFLSTDFADFTDFFCVLNRRQRRRTRKLYMVAAVVIFYFCAFCVFCGWFSSPIQGLEPGATPLPWWAFSLLAILADRSSQQTKILRLWCVPADGVEPPQGPCRARDG